MTTRFDKLNRWLTLIANLAVVGGIVFLGLEISQNNSMAELQQQATVNARVNALIDMVIADPTLIDLMRQDPSSLDESGAARLRLLGTRLLLGFEEGFLDMQAGRAEQASTMRTQRAVYNRPILNYGAPFVWESFKAQADPEFVEWFEANVTTP